ncbi:MAG: lysylphosphatidylglycerol synthase transmembrane domain-containing protein [Planctomycetota bacterium]
MTKKGILFFLLRISIAVGLVVWLISSDKIDFSILFGSKFGWGWALLSLSTYLIIIFIATFRWQLLLNAQEIKVPFKILLRLTFIGWFFNISMPGATGGDVIRAYYASLLSPEKKTESVTVVFFDRFIGLSAMALLSFIVAGLYILIAPAVETIKMLFAGVTLSLFLLFLFLCLVISRYAENSKLLKWCKTHLPFGGIFEKAHDSLILYKSKKKILLLSVLVSLAAHVIMTYSNYLFAVALDMEVVSFLRFLFLIPVGLFIDCIPISIAGIGWGEAAYGALFPLAGYAAKLGICIAALMHCAKIIWAIPGLFLYLGGRKHYKKPVAT